MEPPTCLIIANGPWPAPGVMEAALKGPAIVLACDGAVASCMKHNLDVHAVVGDLDSLDAETFALLAGMRVIERLDQDSNDLSKAIDYALDQGHTNLRIVGATGGDVQHEWANILECARRTVNIEMLGERGRFCFLVSKEQHTLQVNKEGTFSLMALNEVAGLNLGGALYSLTDDELGMGSRGLHNMATDSQIKVRYDSGRLVVVLPM